MAPGRLPQERGAEDVASGQGSNKMILRPLGLYLKRLRHKINTMCKHTHRVAALLLPPPGQRRAALPYSDGTGNKIESDTPQAPWNRTCARRCRTQLRTTCPLAQLPRSCTPRKLRQGTEFMQGRERDTFETTSHPTQASRSRPSSNQSEERGSSCVHRVIECQCVARLSRLGKRKRSTMFRHCCAHQRTAKGRALQPLPPAAKTPSSFAQHQLGPLPALKGGPACMKKC